MGVMETKSLTGMIFDFFSEPTAYFWLGVLLAFFHINFNPEFALVYGLLLVADIAGFVFIKPKFRFSNIRGNSLSSLLVAFVGFVAVLTISVGAFMFLQSSLGLEPTFSAVIRHMQTVGKELVFAGNRWFTLVAWGVVAAIIETRVLVGWVMQSLSKIFSVPLILKFSFAILALLVVMASIATFFHFQAKGITDNVALLITWIFFFVSGVMVLQQQELEGAIYMHIINNVITVGRQVFGWFI